MLIFHKNPEQTFVVFVLLQESATEPQYKGAYLCLKDVNVLPLLLLMRLHSATEATMGLDD